MEDGGGAATDTVVGLVIMQDVHAPKGTQP